MLVATVVSRIGSQLKLNFLATAFPPDGSSTALPIVLTGIPQITRSTTSAVPIIAALDPTQTELTLDYDGSAFTSDETFTLGPQDPAIRTATGGFAAPAVLTAIPAGPTVVAYTLESFNALAGTMRLNFGGSTSPLIASPWLFRETNSGLFAESGSFDGTHLDLVFPSAIDPAPESKYQAPDVQTTSAGVFVPTADPVS